jgi:hypothetical protein
MTKRTMYRTVAKTPRGLALVPVVESLAPVAPWPAQLTAAPLARVAVLVLPALAALAATTAGGFGNAAGAGIEPGAGGSAAAAEQASTVGQDGATLRLGTAELVVPAGALSKNVVIGINTVPSPVPIGDRYLVLGSVYAITPTRTAVLGRLPGSPAL